MPERSFGRTIRYRRTKMGLSQAKLGDLVGRSASTIRSWERGNSVPNEKSVVDALAAVLAIDRRLLYTKTGIEEVAEETSPTVEQALATLGPNVVAATDETPVPDLTETSMERDLTDEPPPVSEPLDGGAPASPPEVAQDDDAGVGEDAVAPLEIDPFLEVSEADDAVDDGPIEWPEPPPSQLPVPPVAAVPTPPPGYVAPKDNLVYAPAAARVAEPSYIEDGSQRQVYRIRALATVVLVVAMVVVLIWAASNAWDSFTTWWSDFFGNLRL